jgi:GH15 family glucan-1,4-alpha-glucosidase
VAVDAAIDLITEVAHADSGFYGAATPAGSIEREDHYTSVWARDAAHTIIGVGSYDFLEPGDQRRTAIEGAAKASLLTLVRGQYPSGQIPNVVWPQGSSDTGFVPYADCGETGGIDATSLFLIALGEQLRRHDDNELRQQVVPSVIPAIDWLIARDNNQEGLIDSAQAGDWMDSTFVRSGKTLYNNVLFYRALQCASQLSGVSKYAELAQDLKDRINVAFWPEQKGNWRFMVGPLGTPVTQRSEGQYPHPARQAAYHAAHREDRTHYVSHIEYAQWVDKCDVLANVLAVLYEIPDAPRALSIMRSLHQHSQSLPCPISTYTEPVSAADPSNMYKAHAEVFQGERWRNPPGSYHNAGIWPYIGGYYIGALAKVGMAEEAKSELRRLCATSLDTDFNEWLDFRTGKPGGNPRQTWNAALLLHAASALKRARSAG